MEEKGHTHFSGTYFDKDSVLRFERWVCVIAWAVLAAYIIDAGYSTYQAVTTAVINNYSIDFSFVFGTILRILQGSVLFALLYGLGKVMLILLDIEDNTRRATRK